MGIYMYKVTAKRVQLTDGTEANVAMYAYKPYFWASKGEEHISKRNSGCYVAERFVNGKNYTGKIVMGGIYDGVLKYGKTVKRCRDGYFEDGYFGKMETVGIAIGGE